MTQFGPPPYPPPTAPFAQRIAPPPWSAAAIAAFVLALLGFLGFTAILGVIFALVALFTTSGGRRRGMGLAIAAIPISLMMGVVSVFLLLLAVSAMRMTGTPKDLQTVFSSSADSVEAIGTLRRLASDDWNRAVSDEDAKAWLESMHKKYGALTSVRVDRDSLARTAADGSPRIAFPGKFVNGTAVIAVTFDIGHLWDPRWSDIEVDGSSPRGDGDSAPAESEDDRKPTAP